MTGANADPHAVAVARAVNEHEQPQATILFGSRARGDYHDQYSDIDLLLVCEQSPGYEIIDTARAFAHHTVQAVYHREVPFQPEYVCRNFFDA